MHLNWVLVWGQVRGGGIQPAWIPDSTGHCPGYSALPRQKITTFSNDAPGPAVCTGGSKPSIIVFMMSPLISLL